MRILDILYGKELLADYLVSNGYKKNTIKKIISDVTYFNAFLNDSGVSDLRDITKNEMVEYVGYVRSLKRVNKDAGLSDSTKKNILNTAKLLFKALYLNEKILLNPAHDLPIYKKSKHPEKEIFGQNEINDLLDSIDISDISGLRDRACFELIYSSGLRVGEVSFLDIGDIDFDDRIIILRQAKFNKDRIIPISDVALRFLKLYLSDRISLKNEAVFTGKNGRLKGSTISCRFTEILKSRGMKKERLSVHSIRHSTATHLLEHGADIRYVQELLGHSSIETTMEYTHMMYDNMKRIYKQYHPRENAFFVEVSDDLQKNIYDLIKRIKKSRGIKE